jgi:rare lipoprotein A (peptidoglycan hydrolase)
MSTTTAPPPPPTSTTTAVPPPPAPAPTTTTAPRPPHSASGQATWYPEAAPGRCASPSLGFGTVLRVTNVETGASTTCIVDDREADNQGRVVDLSPSGFAQIASMSGGVVTVTITW